MVRPLIVINMAALFCVAFSFSLMAEPAFSQQEVRPPTLAPLALRGQYDFEFSGIPVARIGVEFSQTSSRAQATSDIMSVGIVDRFVRHSSHTTLVASGINYVYPQRTYETNYRTRKKKRHVKMVVSGDKVVEHLVEPAENPAKRPPVTDEEKNSAFDPLSFVFAMRKEVFAAVQQGKREFTLRAFDGRRLTEAQFTVLGSRTLRMGEKKLAVQSVSVKRKLINGFTKDELEEFDPKEPALTVHFSDDERFIPVQLDVPLLMQRLTARLNRECAPTESCLLGNTD
jgi:hypothetical protein